MPNHFAAIGYLLENDVDIDALVDKAARDGDPIAAPSGYYLQYHVDDRIELWAQATPIGDLLDCVPFFRGDSRIKIGVADLIRRKDRPLDGSVYGWVNPTGDRADGGDYPVVIKIPDYEIFRARVALHTVTTMQVTAFANELTIYPDDAAFTEAQPDRQRMAPESFIPTGMFSDSGSDPDAQAIFSGHVAASEIRTNPESGRPFCYMLVSTFGGQYDVVVDTALVVEAPAVGSVIQGSFWLTGRHSL